MFAQLFYISSTEEGAAAIEKAPGVVRWMGRVDEAAARWLRSDLRAASGGRRRGVGYGEWLAFLFS